MDEPNPKPNSEGPRPQNASYELCAGPSKRETSGVDDNTCTNERTRVGVSIGASKTSHGSTARHKSRKERVCRQPEKRSTIKRANGSRQVDASPPYLADREEASARKKNRRSISVDAPKGPAPPSWIERSSPVGFNTNLPSSMMTSQVPAASYSSVQSNNLPLNFVNGFPRLVPNSDPIQTQSRTPLLHSYTTLPANNSKICLVGSEQVSSQAHISTERTMTSLYYPDFARRESTQTMPYGRTQTTLPEPRGQSPQPSTASSAMHTHSDLSQPTVPAFHNFACYNVDCCDDEDCDLSCNNDCENGDCTSCDGSQTCCEPCNDAEVCTHLECDDPCCFDDSQLLCMSPRSPIYHPNPAMTSPSSEMTYVNPRQVLLDCHWETSGQQCDASMPSKNALSQHIRQDHLQQEALRPCHWDTCDNQIDVDNLPGHVWNHHSPTPRSDSYVCLWQGCHLSFSTPDELDQHMKAIHCQMNCHWDGCEQAMVGETAMLAHVDDQHLGVASTSSTTSPTIDEVSTPKTPDLAIADKDLESDFIQKHSLRHSTTSQGPASLVGCDGQKICQWNVSEKPCGCVFKNGNDLQTHVEDVHLDDLRRSKDPHNVCLWLGCPSTTSFSERGKLTRHMYIHTKYMVGRCRFCGKEYNSTVQLSNHERTHTKERPFPCEKCGFRAANKAALTTHMRTHTGEKPLKCDKCDYTCGDPSNMSKHRKTHEAPNHKCEICGKSFCRANTLKRHMQVHE